MRKKTEDKELKLKGISKEEALKKDWTVNTTFKGWQAVIVYRQAAEEY